MRIIVILIISFLQFSCSQKNLTKTEIQKIVQLHYKDDSFFKKTKTTIKLIKEVDDEYKALIVKIDDKNYSYGFISNAMKKFIPVQEFKEHKDKITHASNWGINFINIKGDKITTEAQFYSVFLGINPYKGFSKIEMSWNCDKTETTELINGKYFMFVYPKKEMRRCNTIYLITEKGDKTKVVHQNGKFLLK